MLMGVNGDSNVLGDKVRPNFADPEIVKKFDGMYVDFYLEDDMFEIEGQFFTIDGQLFIEVHDAVMHILEMAGKELKVWNFGDLYRAQRPDGQTFMMEINRVYFKMEDPKPEDFIKMRDEHGVNEFFLKLTDIMVFWKGQEKKWDIVKNKIDMIYAGDIVSYDSIEELFADNENLGGLWQAVIFQTYEEESNYGNTQMFEGLSLEYTGYNKENNNK